VPTRFIEMLFPTLLPMLAALSLLWSVPGASHAADPELTWVDAQTLTIEGKGWPATEAPYDRLPAKAKGVVRDAVWQLSRNSAGLCVRFQTAAETVHVKWEVTGGLAMPHMPATGVSGVDLYARTDRGWHFVGNGRPETAANEAVFYAGKAAELCLYLPLYNATKSVQIGVPAGQAVTAAPARGKPVVVYGTSITQGGCASRPGMAYTNILGRRLGVPIINLGFSGNGQSEPELADLLREVDASAYVLDALWNMSPEMVRDRIPPFVHKLRAARPTTPVLLVEDTTIRGDVPTAKGKVLREVFARLQQEGVGKPYFLSAEGMLGPDDEGTVDGCHPTDLGFMYQAKAFEAALRPILGH
jgi:hypothetical protein